jgi:hypothetical protein
LEEVNVNEDIGEHIRAEFDSHPKLSRWPAIVQQKIRQSLMANAHGMYVQNALSLISLAERYAGFV